MPKQTATSNIKTKTLAQSAFTIVELLVIIVVIGILAAITIISYTGIRQKAAIATLQSDLKNSSNLLAIDNVINSGIYPASEALANEGKGLPKSPNTTYTYVPSGTSYCISATSPTANATYHVSSDNGSIEEGACPTVGPYWKQLASGSGWGHTCAIASDDLVYCWGNNNYGQLGTNSTTWYRVPTKVNNDNLVSALYGKTVKSISAGAGYTCAIASDDLAYCWGENDDNQLGDGSSTERHAPVAVSTAGALNGKTIKSISTGYSNSCAIASDNLAYCWGDNYHGELGNGSTVPSNVPVPVSTSGALSGKTIKAISNDYYSVCAIASDDNVYCWGQNFTSLPVAVDTSGVLSGKTIKSIASGSSTCVIASDDLAYCWGANDKGQLGNNSTVPSPSIPVAVNMTSGISALHGKTVKSIEPSAGGSVCVIASDDLTYCWGWNGFGQNGNDSVVNSLAPVAVDTSSLLNNKTIKHIAIGLRHTCAIASDDQIYCWGDNSNAQYGNNTTATSHVPVATQQPPL